MGRPSRADGPRLENVSFTANQIATLMGLLAFDEGKIDAAVAAWPRCVDPQNSFVLYKKLAFDDSREQLRKRISR